MEYCAFGTLLHAMNLYVFRLPEPHNQPDVEMICSVLLELASSLTFLHKHGIIHCDLKPQNVLLKVDSSNPRGFVTKLADFGLARVVTQASAGLHVCLSSCFICRASFLAELSVSSPRKLSIFII